MMRGGGKISWEGLAEYAGIKISGNILLKLDIYLQELIKWSRKFNITGILNLREIQIKHFQDSFFLLSLLPDQIAFLVDIGSGGGFPGLPIKICRPYLNVTLIEPNSHKFHFLLHMKRALELYRIDIYHGKIENWIEDTQEKLAKTRGLFFVSRAWKKPRNVIKELAKQLKFPENGLLLMLGARGENELKELATVGKSCKLKISRVQKVALMNNLGLRVNLLLQPK